MKAPSPSGTVCLAIETLSGRVRGVLALDDGRFTLAETKGRTAEDVAAGAVSLFEPATMDRLVLFAERAVAGDMRAVAHPKAILMLATTVLALVAAINLDPATCPKEAPHAGPDQPTFL